MAVEWLIRAVIGGGILATIGIPALIIVLLMSLKVVNEYERGVKFRFGRFVGMMDPGLRIILPVIESWYRVDMRVVVVDVPPQDTITKDNISVKVNAVLYYKVADASKSILEVEHYEYAVSQLAQTTMRDVVGTVELDTLLSHREDISRKILVMVDKATDPWGIKIQNVELKHIDLPEEMIRTIAKQAEAERERRAVIINSEGERLAADNIVEAARKLVSTKGALHLRTLHTINDISSDKSNTIVLAIPLEILRAFGSMGQAEGAQVVRLLADAARKKAAPEGGE